MKRSFLADSIIYFFVTLFVYTGVVKLMDVHTVETELVSSSLVGAFAGVIAWVLPIGELLLALLLFVPRWRLWGMYLTVLLMTAFTGYVITLLFIDEGLSCSCGGIIEALTPKEHLLFNLSCVILSIVAILVLRRQEPTPSFKRWTNSSAAALFALVGWILFTAFTAPAVAKTGHEGQILPAFKLQLPDSTTYFNTADIPSGRSFIMIGFSPTCRHCREQLVDIIKHIDEFKTAHIYYVTTATFARMKTFYQINKLEKYPNIVVGRDSANRFFSYFKAPGTPYTTIYDSKKRLRWVMPNQPNAA